MQVFVLQWCIFKNVRLSSCFLRFLSVDLTVNSWTAKGKFLTKKFQIPWKEKGRNKCNTQISLLSTEPSNIMVRGFLDHWHHKELQSLFLIYPCQNEAERKIHKDVVFLFEPVGKNLNLKHEVQTLFLQSMFMELQWTRQTDPAPHPCGCAL